MFDQQGHPQLVEISENICQIILIILRKEANYPVMAMWVSEALSGVIGFKWFILK